MEAIFYSIGSRIIPLAIFLIFILMLGILIYHVTRKFDIHKKVIHYAGLLTELSNRQICILSSLIIKTFFMIYTAITYEKDIVIYLIMIILIDMVYIILTPRKLIFETINVSTQVTLIHLIHVLKLYKIEVSNQNYISQVIWGLIGVIIIDSLYFLLKNFEDLIAEKRKGKKKNEKAEENE